MKFLVGIAVLAVLGVAGPAFAEEPEKIVGGRFARDGEFPHQVSLRMNGQHICGGSIISNFVILTAAHCVYGIVRPPYNNFYVVTGTNSLKYGGQSHAVQAVNYHEAYQNSQQTSWRHDVAVIRLKNPITFNASQRPIALPSQPHVANSQVVLSGFGLTSVNGQVSENLKTTPMRIVGRQACQQANRQQPIYEGHVCAILSSGVGACMGDSGGPLTQGNTVVGIVSWVVPCARGFPDVFTDVYTYVNWIRKFL